MAIVQPSIGYPGNLSADPERWSRAQWGLGRRYWVYDYAALLCTPVQGGTRQVQLSGGAFGGQGVIDQNDAPVLVTLPAVATGTQWFLVVARRIWGTTNQTSFVAISGPVQASPPTDLTGFQGAGKLRSERGVEDDQPLWIVPLQAGFTVPGTPIDVRLLGTDKGPMVAHSKLVLQYATWEGAEIQIGSRVHRRVSDPSTGTSKWIDFSTAVSESDTLQVWNGADFLTKSPNFTFTKTGLVNKLRRHRNLYEITLQLQRNEGTTVNSVTTTSDNFADTPLAVVKAEFRPPEDVPVPVVYRGVSGGSGSAAIVGGMARLQASDGTIDFISGAANYALVAESAGASGSTNWTVRAKFSYFREL